MRKDEKLFVAAVIKTERLRNSASGGPRVRALLRLDMRTEEPFDVLGLIFRATTATDSVAGDRMTAAIREDITDNRILRDQIIARCHITRSGSVIIDEIVNMYREDVKIEKNHITGYVKEVIY